MKKKLNNENKILAKKLQKSHFLQIRTPICCSFRNWTSKFPSKHVELIELAAQSCTMGGTAMLEILCSVFCQMTWDSSGISTVQVAFHERSPVRQNVNFCHSHSESAVGAPRQRQAQPANYVLNRDSTYPMSWRRIIVHIAARQLL